LFDSSFILHLHTFPSLSPSFRGLRRAVESAVDFAESEHGGLPPLTIHSDFPLPEHDRLVDELVLQREISTGS